MVGLCAFMYGFVDSHLINRYPNFILQLDPGAVGKDSPACSGSPAALTGPSGEFGISQSQYKDNLQCGWKITVEAGEVIKGSVPPVFIFSLYCAIMLCNINYIYYKVLKTQICYNEAESCSVYNNRRAVIQIDA